MSVLLKSESHPIWLNKTKTNSVQIPDGSFAERLTNGMELIEVYVLTYMCRVSATVSTYLDVAPVL